MKSVGQFNSNIGVSMSKLGSLTLRVKTKAVRQIKGKRGKYIPSKDIKSKDIARKPNHASTRHYWHI